MMNTRYTHLRDLPYDKLMGHALQDQYIEYDDRLPIYTPLYIIFNPRIVLLLHPYRLSWTCLSG